MDPQFCQSNHVCLHSDYQMCPTTLPANTFTNQECVSPANLANDRFIHCLNRGDARLFEKNVFKKTKTSPNLNQLLDANEHGFNCNDKVFLHWTASDLDRFSSSNPQFIRSCILKNKEKIDRVELVRLLKNDQAFEYRKKLPLKIWETTV